MKDVALYPQPNPGSCEQPLKLEQSSLGTDQRKPLYTAGSVGLVACSRF